MDRHPLLERIFRRIVALRLPVLAVYALLLPAAIALALRIPSEGAIDKLIVPTDPDFVATRAFQKVFPEGQIVMLLLESDDPWTPEVVGQAAALEERLAKVPGVHPVSALDVFRRQQPGFQPDAASVAAFEKFATGTDILRRQGLVGDRFLAVVAGFGGTAKERGATLAAIEKAVGT
ncbi:MAG TPA: hypothetical protein VFM45_04905, partial [Anaeromyxobacteraceae bacterium]|nr:hypothetical protein [Anaeromyxobacteraceae bacterium]